MQANLRVICGRMALDMDRCVEILGEWLLSHEQIPKWHLLGGDRYMIQLSPSGISNGS